MKDGLYEFKINRNDHPDMFYFFRILIINEDKFPEFKDGFSHGNIIHTPVSFSWSGDSYQIFNPFFLMNIGTDYKTQHTVVQIAEDFRFGNEIIFEFNSDSSGNEIYYDQDDIKQISGTFQITKFTPLDDINLEHIRYQARIKKVNSGNFPDDYPCSQKDYQGIAGFIKIPELLADTANGWMVGLGLKHDNCSVQISRSLAGNFQNGLVINDSFVSFTFEYENGGTSAGYDKRLIYINGYPDKNQSMSGKIYLDAPYNKAPQILDVEMYK